MDEELVSPDQWRADRTLDAIGLACPLPVLRARKALAQMRPGSRLLVEASDPMATIDIPHLCHQDGHVLVAQDTRSGPVLRFLIERGEDAAADMLDPDAL